MTASLIIFWFPFDKLNLKVSIQKKLGQILEGWTCISKDHSILIKNRYAADQPDVFAGYPLLDYVSYDFTKCIY